MIETRISGTSLRVVTPTREFAGELTGQRQTHVHRPTCQQTTETAQRPRLSNRFKLKPANKM